MMVSLSEQIAPFLVQVVIIDQERSVVEALRIISQAGSLLRLSHIRTPIHIALKEDHAIAHQTGKYCNIF